MSAAAPHPHEHHERAAGRGRADDQRRLAWTFVLIAGYMLAEFAGGLWTHSLALLADAGHMLSDAAALALSLVALRLARRPCTPRNTYGFYRAEILAALANGSVLVVISIFILIEAVERFRRPTAVLGGGMLGIALGGLAVNLVALWLLHRRKSRVDPDDAAHQLADIRAATAGGVPADSADPCSAPPDAPDNGSPHDLHTYHVTDSLNVRAAALHVLSDTAGSVGAVAAAALIAAFGWTWADPVASVLISVRVIWSAWLLLKETVAILMECTPRHIDADAVRAALLAVPGVLALHDLHIWTITSGLDSLSAHVVTANPQDSTALLRRVRDVLNEQFRIVHVTIQIETTAE